jgi:hypothetical protein
MHPGVLHHLASFSAEVYVLLIPEVEPGATILQMRHLLVLITFTH